MNKSSMRIRTWPGSAIHKPNPLTTELYDDIQINQLIQTIYENYHLYPHLKKYKALMQ